MKRYVLLVLVFLVGCSQQVGSARNGNEHDIENVVFTVIQATQNGKYELLSTNELKMMPNTEYILVDTMPKKNYDAMHIDGAVNIEFSTEKDAKTDEKTQMLQEILGEDLTKPIVFYCGYLTCNRSHIAAKRAMEMGYTNVYRYIGGIAAWKDASLPTVVSQ